MVAKIPLPRAVSIESDPSYCLLSISERDSYPCLETARALSAAEQATRQRAFWRFFKIHIQPLTNWAARHHYYDHTLHYENPREAAGELVVNVLNSFYERICEGHYDVEKGRPCGYVERSIRNRNTDLLRRGGYPTPRECRLCWEEHAGACPSFGTSQPWETHYRRCYQTPQIASFEEHETLFSAAGIQQVWPPYLGEGETSTSIERPVEEVALNHVMMVCITELMQSILNERQRTILVRTFVDHANGREIARELGISLDNVYQIRHRALRRLLKALTF